MQQQTAAATRRLLLSLRRALSFSNSVPSTSIVDSNVRSIRHSDSAIALENKAHSLWEKLSRLSPNSPPDSRLLKVAVLGPTGVGKSSLVNMLACYRSCAVSQKINTTRAKQAVISTRGNTQLVFVDLPGLLSEQRRRRFNLENFIMRDVHSATFQADLILVLADVSHRPSRSRLDSEVLKALHYFADKPSVLVLNKIDLLRGSQVKLLETVRALTDGFVADRVSHVDRYASRIEAIDKQVQLLLAQEGRSPKALAGDSDCDDSAGSHRLWDRRWERHLVPPLEQLQRHLVPPPDVLMWGSNPPAPTPMLTAESRRELALEAESTEAAAIVEDARLLTAVADAEVIANADPLSESSGSRTPTLSQLDPFTLWLREQMLLGSVTKEQALARRKQWREISRRIVGQTSWRGFQEAFMVSAATGDGVDQLRDYLFAIAQPKPWLFHSSCLSDMEPNDLVKMCIWARCLDLLPQEVPYQLDFELQDMDKSHDGRVFISVCIRCSSLRALASVIGQDGGTIKKIAASSKLELQDVFRANVVLKLAAVRATVPGGHLSFIKKSKSLSGLFPEVMRNV